MVRDAYPTLPIPTPMLKIVDTEYIELYYVLHHMRILPCGAIRYTIASHELHLTA